MTRFLRSVRAAHPRLIVAGGGIGGVEAALALRALAGDGPAIELIAPEPEFAYRAMTVAEPYGCAPPKRIGFERLARTHAIHHRADSLAGVDPEAGTAELHGGERLAYSALVVAVGARPEPWLPGALTFTGPAAVPLVRDLLARLETGSAQEIVFTAPAGASWTLPLYELALLTSAWCAERSLPAPRLHVVTSESAPLEIFGAAATRVVCELLADRGITIHTGTEVTSYEEGRAHLAAGLDLDADAVVALPRLAGNAVPGLPVDAGGFIPVDEHCRVTGVPDVYAVGDATTHAVKQGGLAAQQADVAAAAIARSLGVPVDAPPYRPVMRGMLLTGVTSAFLRSDSGTDVAAFNALWWPPTKVAGRYLSALLADVQTIGQPEGMFERRPADDLEGAARSRAEMRALALEMATTDAQWEDYGSAARWLQTIEWLDGALPADLALRRDQWLARAAAGS